MSTAHPGLTAAHAEVKAEIARTDNKTALLLAFVGALLAGVWTVATQLPLNVAAYAVGAAGVAVLLAAAGLLLRAVRPNLGGTRPIGFPLWATLSAEQVSAELSEDRMAQHVVNLSRIAVAKFTALRRAVDLIYAGGTVLILAGLAAAGGAWL